MEEKNENQEKTHKPKVSFFKKIPYSVKAILIKYWFYGLYYYFIIMGIGSLFPDLTSSNTITLVVIFCFAAGLSNDLLLDTILDVIENIPGESQKFVFFKKKKSVLSTIINVVYGFIWGFISLYIPSLYVELNESISWLGREPFTFALIALAVDMIFVGLKDLIVYLVKRFILKR